MTVFIIIFGQLLLPILLTFLVWKYDFKDSSLWGTAALFISGYIALLFVVGSWGWVGYAFRWILPALVILALYASFKRIKEAEFWLPKNWIEYIVGGTFLLSGGLIWFFTLFAFTGYSAPDESYAISSPLKNGVYIVGHGGSNPAVNYHNVSKSQKYALDITKLNAFTLRAKGILPDRLAAYAIYKDTLCSPCNGTVKAVRDSLGDAPIFEPNSEYPPGNYIVLACDSVSIYMAHLYQNSIRPDSGDVVQTGDPIALIGNSGNTSEPHLHIHAERGPYDGKFSGKEGVALRIDGRFLVRNSIFW